MTAKEHNKILSILMLVQGGLQILGGVVVVLIYGGFGFFMLNSSRRDESSLGGILIGAAIFAALLVLVLAAIDFLAGWKLFKEKSGARTWGIVASIISLLGFPLGTALGIYGLWFLFGEAGKRFYAGGDAPSGFSPPPPNHWR